MAHELYFIFLGACDFENGMCGLTQSKFDDFDFERRSGSSDSLYTGPSTDHTLGTALGYYIYIETSYPRLYGQKAEVMTAWFKGSSPRCELTFAYHMYGYSVGTLKVHFYF